MKEGRRRETQKEREKIRAEQREWRCEERRGSERERGQKGPQKAKCSECITKDLWETGNPPSR